MRDESARPPDAADAASASGHSPVVGPHHLPAPSLWPMVCAGGIALVFFGIVTSLIFSLVGLALFAWAIVGWIGEVRRES